MTFPFLFFFILTYAFADTNPTPAPAVTQTPVKITDTSGPISKKKAGKIYHLPINRWEVGQSVTYETIDLINSTTVVKDLEQTFSIVDEEEHNGKKYVSLELESGPIQVDGSLKNPMHFKIVLPTQDQRTLEDFIYNGNVDAVMPLATVSDMFLGLPAQFVPVSSDNQSAISQLLGVLSNVERDQIQNSTETPEVPLTVPGGTFLTTKYQKIDDSNGTASSFWRDSRIPIWGIVKSEDITGLGSGTVLKTEMVLKSFSMRGAKTRIHKRIFVLTHENLKRRFGKNEGNFSFKFNHLDNILKNLKQ
jgi:hypothetical protein